MGIVKQKKHIFFGIILCAAIFFLCGLPGTVFAQQGIPADSKPFADSIPDNSKQSKQVKKNEVHMLDEIVVTAGKLEEYIKNHPQSIVSLDQKEIIQRNFLHATEALNSMSGVDVRQGNSGSGVRISIRGSGGSGSVLVLVDGRPVNSGQYGSVDLETIPIDIISKITVFKPPVPVWLGPGSSSGAVSIITKNFDSYGSKKAGSAKKSGRLKLGTGSFGVANFSCSYSMPHEKGSTMITAGATHTDGKRTNSDKDRLFLSVNWNKKNSNNTQYKIGGRYYHAEHGCSGPLYNLTPDSRQKYDKGSVDFSIKGFTGKTGEFSLKSYADIKDIEDYSQNGDKSMLEVYKTGINSEHTWAEDSGLWAFRFGGTLEQDHVDHTSTGDIDSTGKHKRDKMSLHIQYDRLLGDFSTSLGIRGDHTSDFDYSPAGNFGVSCGIGNKIVIKTNAGYTENIPSFGKLYQPSHGSINQVRGNPDLLEEKIFSCDFGFEYKYTKDAVLNTALFRTETKDLIVYERGIDLVSMPRNIEKGKKQGVEVSFKYNYKAQLFADFNYIWQETENTATCGDLSYSPAHKGKLSLKYVLPAKTRFITIVRAVSSQYTDIENSKEEQLASYTTVDFKIIQPVRIKTLKSELYIHFINLFDTYYESHYGYPDDGFRFISGVNINF